MIKSIFSNLKDIFLFKDLLYTLTAFIEIFLFYKLIKRINGIFLCIIIGNIIFFYAPLEKRYPKFLFRIRMFIKEIIEGILCLFALLIPMNDKKK